MPYKDPEKRREFQAKYREKYREKIREYDRKYRLENLERVREICRQAGLRYYANNREELREEAAARNQTSEWKKYQSVWYAKNKERIAQKNKELWLDPDFKDRRLAYQKERRERLMEEVDAIKAEIGCACGEKGSACLDFHHVDPSQKKNGISKMVQSCMAWESIVAEMEKCRVLCANCHRKHHRNGLS